MIQQASNRHASADKDHSSTQNLRVGMNEALTFHGLSFARGARRFKPGISRFTPFTVYRAVAGGWKKQGDGGLFTNNLHQDTLSSAPIKFTVENLLPRAEVEFGSDAFLSP